MMPVTWWWHIGWPLPGWAPWTLSRAALGRDCWVWLTEHVAVFASCSLGSHALGRRQRRREDANSPVKPPWPGSDGLWHPALTLFSLRS